MQKFDFKFINSEFGNSEIGYANIFYKYYTGKIYVLNLKTKFGYLWNEKTKLYEELTDTILIPQISKLLQTMMDTMIQATKDNDLLDETEREKKIKSQLERKSKFGTSSTTTNIYKFLLSKYVDESKIKLFDNMENMIAIKGGKVINLKTGKTEERTSEHYFTSEQDNNYLGYGDEFSPKTKIFFMQLACNNKEKYRLMRLVFGSSITTDIMMKCFFILFGAGDNGKSLLLAVMEGNFKNRFMAINPNLLFAEKKDKVSNTSYGTMIGKTIGSCGEPDGKYINGAIIKSLTGGDNVEGKKLYCDPVTFVPVVKIFIYLNNVITIEDDPVMRKRTVVLNFDAKFVENPNPEKTNEFKIDVDLKEKFFNEYKDDFFTFIVNSAIDYLQMENRDLRNVNTLQTQERDSYFDQMDYFGAYLKSEFVITKDKKDIMYRSDLNEQYEKYCSENGKTFNKKKFIEYCAKVFGNATKNQDGLFVYKGIRQKTESELEAELEALNESDKIQEKNVVVKTVTDKTSLIEMNQKLSQDVERLMKQNYEQSQLIQSLLEKLEKQTQSRSKISVVEDEPETLFNEDALTNLWGDFAQ